MARPKNEMIRLGISNTLAVMLAGSPTASKLFRPKMFVVSPIPNVSGYDSWKSW